MIWENCDSNFVCFLSGWGAGVFVRRALRECVMTWVGDRMFYFGKKSNIRKNCSGLWGGQFYARHKKIRFFFVNAIAAFLVGFERGFKYVRDGVFQGFDFMRIYVAWW
jgi:hypothetical protein